MFTQQLLCLAEKASRNAYILALIQDRPVSEYNARAGNKEYFVWRKTGYFKLPQWS